MLQAGSPSESIPSEGFFLFDVFFRDSKRSGAPVEFVPVRWPGRTMCIVNTLGSSPGMAHQRIRRDAASLALAEKSYLIFQFPL